MSTAPAAVPELCVPADLTDYDSWVLWRYELRGGKKAKVPYNIAGRRASTTNPQDWASFEVALSTWRKYPKGYAGLGFVFSKADPFAGIDLDDVLDSEGQVKPWARRVIERFSDTYMEISPSGTGIKIWARGSLPENVPGVPLGDGSIEVYDRGRYFTVTGQTFRGATLQIEDHANDLQLLYENLRASPRKTWPVQPLTDGRIPYGRQHNTLVSIAGTLRARRVCDAAIEACLLKIVELQCERPMEPAHIFRIVKSSRGWSTR